MPVTPEYISGLINFYSNTLEPSWSYDAKGTDMRNLQAKGAAKVFNLLEEYKITLLADEVGMGKTIQALSVCAALWNEKPDAKILVLAPRNEIAKNWEKEYQTFIRHHYRHNDNILKSISGQLPVKKMIFCQNLYGLVHEIQQGWGQLFLGKISSFSGLMAGKKSIERLQKLKINGLAKAIRLSSDPNIEFNNEVARLIKNEIIQYANGSKPYFDLIIIDEAHYFRNKGSDSLRVNTAREIFGDPFADNYIPIANKVLLLTATPNHSSSKDIGSIVSYFTKRFGSDLGGIDYKSVLDKICVRRLRRLSKIGYNKYNYRDEIPSPSDFRENPLSEMFFGLYQHELAVELNTQKKDSKSGKGISRMMKYLEGVEFIPFEKPNENVVEEKEDDDNKGISVDYTTGSDAHILLRISKKFRELFEKDPKHPKYDKLIEDLTQKHNGEKSVVFVRRIPSVFEISKRVIEFYDKEMWKILQYGNLEGLHYEKLDRRTFKKYSTFGYQSEEDHGGVSAENMEEDGNIPSSKVLNLFKTIKNVNPKSTPASNFRSRFNHSKPNIFALFFSPGQDYFSAPYSELKSYRFEVGNEPLENYYYSALKQRADAIPEKEIAKDILSSLLGKNPIKDSVEEKELPIPTIITIFWDIFLNDSDITDKQREIICDTYMDFSPYEKEAFSNFLEKGSLLASEAVVHFYKIYNDIQTIEGEKPMDLYLRFAQEVKAVLKDLKLYWQIQESIIHFRTIYTKVYTINGEINLLTELWDNFNNSQPIYPYSAKNNNINVRNNFNTPFFPDILVATSVLQEGVNLQYFCNTVYHYGMAWTPGDNEQRIGRIDRMFGKIERLLEKDEKSRLHIYYPYLKDTIDEEHLSRFAKRKYKEETLIDKGKAFEESEDFAIAENDNDSWKQFLRKPEDQEISDPFPAVTKDFIGVKAPRIKKEGITLENYYHSIINAIKDLKDFKPEIYFVNQDENQKILLDPTLPGERKQPVIIELVFDHIATGLLGKDVFCLRMKTPLAALFQYKLLKGKFSQNKSIQDLYLPGIKLCMDTTQAGGVNWGLYMANELPLFITDLNENLLSIEEVQHAYINLIRCADLTEKEIFDKDLHKEELNLPINLAQGNSGKEFRRSKKQKFDRNWIQKGEYYILEVEHTSQLNFDFEKQALINNHKNYYVKTLYSGGMWKYQVAYLIHDAHDEELEILEKHLFIATTAKAWEQ